MSICNCIGVIMDGNRRWAKENSLPSLEGHRRGYAKLKEFLGWAKESQIKVVIAFALSTENWKRTREEVGYLMDLFRYALGHEIDSLIKENTKLVFIGDKSAFPDDIQKLMNDAEEKTKNFPGTILAIAASYGGRQEILEAAKKLAEKVATITEESFAKALYTHDLADPDIILRTGGEERLSGFLTWQSVYSELFFTKTLWPDISREEFQKILAGFEARKRNFGK